MLYSLFLFTEQPISSMRLLLFTCLIKQRTIDVTMLAIEFRWGKRRSPTCAWEKERGERGKWHQPLEKRHITVTKEGGQTEGSEGRRAQAKQRSGNRQHVLSECAKIRSIFIQRPISFFPSPLSPPLFLDNRYRHQLTISPPSPLKFNCMHHDIIDALLSCASNKKSINILTLNCYSKN